MSTSSDFWRCMNNTIHRPSRTNSAGYNPVGHPNLFSKFRHAHFFTLKFHNAVRAFVALLICLGGPAAVLLEVPKVVVFPVNGMLVRRGVPHVFDEVLVNLPPFTDRNVSFGIPTRFQGFIAGSAGAHILPDGIGAANHSATVATASGSVNHFACADHRPHFAPAGLDFTLAQGHSIYRLFCATFAPAEPVDVSMYILMRSSDYRHVSEGLTSKVFDVRVKGNDANLVLAHDSDGLSSSERQSRLTAGACASSHKLTHAST